MPRNNINKVCYKRWHLALQNSWITTDTVLLVHVRVIELLHHCNQSQQYWDTNKPQAAGSEHRWHCCRGLITCCVGRAQNKWTRWLSRRSLCFQLIREKGRCHERHTQLIYTTNLPTFKVEEGKYQWYQFFMQRVNSDAIGSHARGCLTKLGCEQDVSTGFIWSNIQSWASSESAHRFNLNCLVGEWKYFNVCDVTLPEVVTLQMAYASVMCT